MGVQLDLEIGQPAQRLGHDLRTPGRRDRIGKHERERRDAFRAHRLREGAQIRQHRPRALDQVDAFGRELDPPPVRLDDAKTHRFLECLDALTHRGLREPQPDRRFADGATLLQGGERLDPVQYIPSHTELYSTLSSKSAVISAREPPAPRQA